MAASNKTMLALYTLIAGHVPPERLTPLLIALKAIEGNASFRATTAAIWAHHDSLHGRASPPAPRWPFTFDVAWAKMAAKGYRYGADALEQVRLGWDMFLRFNITGEGDTTARAPGVIDAPPAVAKGGGEARMATKRVAVVLNLDVPMDEEVSDIGHALHHAKWELPDPAYTVVSVGKVVETRPKKGEPPKIHSSHNWPDANKTYATAATIICSKCFCRMDSETARRPCEGKS